MEGGCAEAEESAAVMRWAGAEEEKGPGGEKGSSAGCASLPVCVTSTTCELTRACVGRAGFPPSFLVGPVVPLDAAMHTRTSRSCAKRRPGGRATHRVNTFGEEMRSASPASVPGEHKAFHT